MNQSPAPTPESSLFQVNLDINNNYILRSAASWARVLGIAGIIMGAFFFFVAVSVYIVYNSNDGYQTNSLPSIFGGGGDRSVITFVTVLYVIIGLVFIFGAIFSLNFGSKIFRAIRSNDQNALNSSLAALRNYFAFRSIVLIICLLLVIIGVASRL